MKTLPPLPRTYRRTLLGGLAVVWWWLYGLLWDDAPDLGPFEAFINSLEDA